MAKGKFVLGALFGIAAGFAAGILTAPKSGKDTRDELKAKSDAKKAEAIEKAKEYRAKAGDIAGDVVDKAEKVAGQAADRVVDVTEKAADKAGVLTEQAADKVIGTTKDLKSRSQEVSKNAHSTIEKNK